MDKQSSPDTATLAPCPSCGQPPGQKVGPPAMAKCITKDCSAARLSAVTLTEWNARASSPSSADTSEVREEMQECGVEEAFEEADFAILYREINESGTTTLQEITNVPHVFCQEIARQLRDVAQGSAEQRLDEDMNLFNNARAEAFEEAAKVAERDGWEATAAQIRGLAHPSTKCDT